MSPGIAVPKPRHKRGKRKMSERGKITQEVFETVAERSEGVCEWCGMPPQAGTFRDRLEMAHLIRRSQGGRGDQPWMVAALCGPAVNSGTCHNKVDYTAAGRQWAASKADLLHERYREEDWPE